MGFMCQSFQIFIYLYDIVLGQIEAKMQHGLDARSITRCVHLKGKHIYPEIRNWANHQNTSKPKPPTVQNIFYRLNQFPNPNLRRLRRICRSWNFRLRGGLHDLCLQLVESRSTSPTLHTRSSNRFRARDWWKLGIIQ